ncbi:MAG: hypothetical protein BWZ07_02423 [Alphaproteobacteria bacterium ADurb.BinA280]|nr:MAG: hypothetical protein BWZ07_02423 [Alphaproteobacteria bacterium ADurb.BinA280]
MAGLDRERHAVVPLHGRAGVVGHGTFAANFVQTPAIACAFVIEALGEQALVVERPTVAAIMDGIAEEHLWPVEMIEFGQLAEGHKVRNRSCHDFRNRWAARDVDDRDMGNDVGHRNRARRIGLGHRDATEGGAGSNREDRGSMR